MKAIKTFETLEEFNVRVVEINGVQYVLLKSDDHSIETIGTDLEEVIERFMEQIGYRNATR